MGTVKMKSRLTKTEKMKLRVMLARDVLKLMRAKKIKAESMIYVHFRDNVDDVQAALKRATRPCEACMLGAAMLAFAYRHDEVTLGGVMYPGRDDCTAPLLRLFADTELDILEAAFEGWEFSVRGKTYGDEWQREPNNYDERLTAIMKNIIANNGVFVPSDSHIERRA